MPEVEVIIAVHTPHRPIAAAISSVVRDNMRTADAEAAGQVQLRVVCHNVDVDTIAKAVPADLRASVHWMEHPDGIASASGPFNAGMRASDAEFVSIMGSDDTLQPGAIASWLSLARATGAECVQTRLATGRSARPVPTPPVRPIPHRRPTHADPVRDRLSYRSAPLGLVSAEARERLGAQLAPGMPVGGDVPYVTRLWCETAVAVDTRGPAYVIGEEAPDRVTFQSRPIVEELLFIRHLLAADWFIAYPEQLREAVATKLLRIHVFGAISNRPDPCWWSVPQRSALAAITADVLAVGAGVADPLSRADHAVIDAVLDPSACAQRMIDRAIARRRHGRPATLAPRHLSQLLHREAPARFMAASWWAGR
ncbi:MAG: hypothetical protein WBG36_01900 [Ornithinimicrobium sp.]